MTEFRFRQELASDRIGIRSSRKLSDLMSASLGAKPSVRVCVLQAYILEII